MNEPRRTISDADIEAMRIAFYGTTTPEEHAEHHSLFKEYLELKRKREERFEKIKTQVIGSLIVGLAGSIGGALYLAGTWFREHWK